MKSGNQSLLYYSSYLTSTTVLKGSGPLSGSALAQLLVWLLSHLVLVMLALVSAFIST
jgi:hypothetical protein